ncbi:tetratricopeptide repeat protein [Hymenobacter sp. BT188]|nr:tetratricopeptide repeat protein [Hymenobacter sp. BT188]
MTTLLSYGRTTLFFMVCLAAGACTPEDHAVQGGEYMLQENYDSALPEYQLAVQANPQDYASYNVLSLIVGKLNDLASALRYVDTALQINPRYTYAYVARGALQGQAGDSTACFAALTRAIELDSMYVEAYFNRGFFHAQFHSNIRAIADFRQTIELAPTDYAAYYHLGRLLLQQGDRQEGCWHVAKALAIMKGLS